MNLQEAKFLLSARRPDGGDDSDPRMAEALRLSGTDPELRSWFAGELGLDRAMVAGLREVRPPADLRERILAGRRMVEFPARRRIAGWLMAAAAVLVLSLGTAVWFRTLEPKAGPALLAAELGRYLDHEWDHVFDLPSNDFARLQDWLASREDGVVLKVSERLSCSPTYGCKVFSWRGVRATLVCFQPKETAAVIHVVSLPTMALPEFTSELPEYAESGTWNTAMWRTGDRIYVAMTTADRAALAKAL